MGTRATGTVAVALPYFFHQDTVGSTRWIGPLVRRHDVLRNHSVGPVGSVIVLCVLEPGITQIGVGEVGSMKRRQGVEQGHNGFPNLKVLGRFVVWELLQPRHDFGGRTWLPQLWALKVCAYLAFIVIPEAMPIVRERCHRICARMTYGEIR